MTSSVPASSLSSSVSSSSSTTLSLSSFSSSSSSSCPFSRLPAVLLPHVCSHLSTRELFATLVRATKSTRDLLSPACFSFHSLALGSSDLSILASLTPSSLTLSFHRRVLCDLQLDVDLGNGDSRCSVQRALAALYHFPVCALFSFDDSSGSQLTDSELYDLLRHPTVLSCTDLSLWEVHEMDEEEAEVDGTKQFSWADIRLPAVTRLSVNFFDGPRFIGAAAFLTAHTALQQLDVNTLLVSISELTALFNDSTALPHLSQFSLHRAKYDWRKREVYNLTPLLTALATTVMGVSSRVRPMERLHLDIRAERGVFAAAALMPSLTVLELSQSLTGWLGEWTEAQMLTAFPQLQELVVRTLGYDHNHQPVDMFPFLQSMAHRPIQFLSLTTGEPVTFGAAAMAQLAHCNQLRQFNFAADVSRCEWWWMEWTDPASFTSFTPTCLSRLRVFEMKNVKMSAESVTALASAAPQLHELRLVDSGVSCHPAVICAIVGGHCKDIEVVQVKDEVKHVWSNAQTADVINAYQSAVAAAGRTGAYRPFTRLRHLRLAMCWCTPPSVWHALLSILRYASRLHSVAHLSSNDPLAICALLNLPSITRLGTKCYWPPSFATFMDQRPQTGRYRVVNGGKSDDCPCCGRLEPLLELIEHADDETWPPIRLQPRSQQLFTAFQCSLTHQHRAVLVRWAAGDFRAGDEQLSAADSPAQSQSTSEAGVAGRRACPWPHPLYMYYGVIGEETEDSVELSPMMDVSGGESESEDEEKAVE